MSIHRSFYFVLFALLISLFLKVDKINLDIQGKHAWRQSMTSINIRNFVRQDANILNPRCAKYNGGGDNIKRLEFPIMQWSIAMIQKGLGEKIWTSRMAVLIISLFTLFGVYLLCNLLFRDKHLSCIAVWVFSFFPVYFYQSINPLPDNLALCFSVFFLYFFFKFEEKKIFKNLILAASLLCLAALTKLPFVLFGIMPLSSLFYQFSKNKFKPKAPNLKYLLVYGLSSLPIMLWYGWVIPTWEGNNITIGLFDSSKDISIYFKYLRLQLTENIPQIVINLPAVVLLLIGAFFLFKNRKYKSQNVAYLCMSFLMMTLYILFVLKQIREGHDYYFFPFLPLFILLIIYGLKQLMNLGKNAKILVYALLLLMPICCWTKVKDYWDLKYAYFNDDFFLYRDDLRKVAPQNVKCIMVNDYSSSIVPYCIDKEGYIFRSDNLPINWINDLISRKEAFYLYSDSRKVEAQEGFDKCIQEKIGTYGSINVYKLREE